MVSFRIAVATVMTALVSSGTVLAQNRSQWDGVYTNAQAVRGQSIYSEQCANCHGADLRGGEVPNPLVGDEFASRWNKFTLGELFERIKTTMPQARPNSLTDQETADLLALMLAAAGYAPGNEALPLNIAALDRFMFAAERPEEGSQWARLEVGDAQSGTPNTGASYRVPGQSPMPEDRGVPMRREAILGDGPWEYDTVDYRIKVVKVTGSLNHPWGLALLPNSDILVTERPGRLRIVRKGVLDPRPVDGVPEVLARDFDGLMDIALHPNFVENRLVYFTYSKPSRDLGGQVALARGRFDGGYALTDVEDLFIGQPPTPRRQLQSALSRLIFGPDGMIYMTAGNPNHDRLKAQDPTSHRGKVLRLRDDGTAPDDNPFVGKTAYGVAYQPEIYSVGHRSPMGLAFHPQTGELWEVENGPQGGDEVNIILPGRNYGWPVTSLGREYDGRRFPLVAEGMEQPFIFWVPAIAPSGMTFYTGDKFPKWRGNLFVGALRGEHMQRITFNERGLSVAIGGTRNGRERLLYDLSQRVREVKQGPDGYLYVLTDYARGGALLRIEPAPDADPTASPGQ